MSNDEKQTRSLRAIDMTPANFAKAIELALAATDANGWGLAKTADLIGLAERTNPETAAEQWTTYRGDPDGDNVTVTITGNGPTSEANARFFVDARAIVLGMVDRIDELETRLRNAGLPTRQEEVQ